MKKKLDLNIDLSLEQRFQKEFVIKNKDSILLDVKIFNDRKAVSLEGNVVRLYIKKSDDTFVVQGGTDELGDNSILISGNRLLIDVKNSATNVSGLCYGEIEIEDDEGTIATNSFVFEVVDRIGNVDKAIQSVDDIYILGEIEKFIIKAKEDMAVLKEQISEGLVKINEFNGLVVEKTEEVNNTANTAINNITSLGEEVKAEITSTADAKIEDINELITASNDVLSRLTEKGLEASEIRDVLDSLIQSVGDLKANLEAENNKAVSNINELNTLHPQSDVRIETLRALIEEAKQYETIVRDFIASQTGSVDLTEVYEALETLNGYIEDINNRFNNHYTKEEVDMLIEDKTGTIAGSLLPAPYSTEPENPFGDECYITVRAKDKNGVYHIGYGKYYNDNYPTYLSNNNCIYLSNASANIAVYSYTESDKTWTAIANRTFVVAKSPIDVYTNSVDIKYHVNDPNKGQIWKEAFVLSGEEPEIDFNNATEYKRYNINITAEDEIFNAPTTGELKGVLTVDKASNNIIQTVISDQNKRYTRVYCDEIWTEWKEEKEGYSKEDIDEKLGSGRISGIIAPVFDELPDTFTGYPENPDASTYLWEMKCTHYGYHMVFYFPEDPTGKFGIVEKSDGTLGFKLLDDLFTYKTYKGYYRKGTSSTGSWTAFGNDNHFTATDARNLTAMYYHNFNIVNGNNPDEIYRVGYGCSVGDILSDFNKATKYKDYTVNIKSGEDVLNAPLNAPFAGVLKVSNTKALVHQTFETTNGKTFKRMLNGNWTAWKEDVKKNEIENLLTSVPDKINTFTYTNADGMPEIYKWFDLNGFKVMWIDVKLSENEYDSGSSGAMMKTLNFPSQAQIFNNIIMTNITSYNRSGNDTLSRVIQNSEIISNVSVRGRWRHTDNTYPRIDRFTIMCLGI